MTDAQNNIRKELAEMYDSGEAKPLEDLYSLEATSLIIKDLEKKVEFYKDYKKKKTDEIDKEIKKVSSKRDFLKDVIIATLKKNKEKSIKFPGVCSISTRNNPHKWVIADEEEFIKQVEKALAAGESAEGVVEEVLEKHIIKKEANKLLDAWEANGRLDEIAAEFDNGASFAVKEPQTTSVSLKFEKDVEEVSEEETEVDDNVDTSVPKKRIQYDSLQ